MNNFKKIAPAARALIIASAMTTMLGTVPSSAATLGVWEYDGFTTIEEGEGNAGWSASVTMNYGGEEVMVNLSCSKPGKSLGIRLICQESFTLAAQQAIKATKGKIDPDVSYLDIYIDDQIFSMNSIVADYDGSLGFNDEIGVNGPILSAFVRGSNAELNAPGLLFKISLKNSSNAICKALKQCGARQDYCASTGR